MTDDWDIYIIFFLTISSLLWILICLVGSVLTWGCFFPCSADFGLLFFKNKEEKNFPQTYSLISYLFFVFGFLSFFFFLLYSLSFHLSLGFGCYSFYFSRFSFSSYFYFLLKIKKKQENLNSTWLKTGSFHLPRQCTTSSQLPACPPWWWQNEALLL